jgi:hypothetical protein
MWVPKSSEEISAEKRFGRRRQVRTMTAIWIILVMVILVTPPARNPFSVWFGLHLPFQGSLPRRVALPLAAGLLLLASCYWFRFSSKVQTKTWLCPKCETVKAPDGNPDCKCGGKFVDLNTVKWVK